MNVATGIPRIGLALGSGSARGWAHLGVLSALEERGIRPRVVTGASVGALVAAAYASGQSRELEDWVRTLTRVDVWRLLDTTFRGGGVMRGNRLMHAIGEQIEDRRIEDLPIGFGAVAADLDTGEEIWLRSGSMLAAVRASSGMPGLFTPMWHQERWMIDGGVVNPVPVTLCRALGADFVIAVNLNVPVSNRWAALKRSGGRPAARPPQQAEEPAEAGWAFMDKWAELMDGLVETLRPTGNAGPGLFEVIAGSVHIMQDHIARSRMAGDPPNLSITPDLGDFQLMDFHRAAEAIESGRQAVEAVAATLDSLADAAQPASSAAAIEARGQRE
jgi:NTE family protein